MAKRARDSRDDAGLLRWTAAGPVSRPSPRLVPKLVAQQPVEDRARAFGVRRGVDPGPLWPATTPAPNVDAVKIRYASRIVRRRKPGHYHHGDLRNALIEAALQLVAQKGVAGLTLRETARRVGVSQAAPYRHFTDKNALLLALAEEGFRTMHQQIVEALGRAAPDTTSRLSAIGVGYVQFAVTHPAHFRIMFGQELARSVASPTTEQTALAVFQELAAEIVKGQASGFIRQEDPIRLAVACWSIAHGLAAILVEGLLDRRVLGPASAPDPETLTRLVTQLLVVGLASR